MFSRTVDHIVTFGDSLSDSGAVFDLTGALLMDPLALPVGPPLLDPGYAGVLSDGPVFTQLLARQLDASLTGYAVGGARLLGERTLDGRFDAFAPLLDPGADPALFAFDGNVGGQLGRFLAGEAPSPTAAPSAPAPGDTVLATAFYGLNDLTDIATELEQAPFLAGQLIGAAGDVPLGLARSGLVDQIALFALPDSSFFPGGASPPPTTSSLRRTGRSSVWTCSRSRKLRGFRRARCSFSTRCISAPRSTVSSPLSPGRASRTTCVSCRRATISGCSFGARRSPSAARATTR